MDALLKIAFIAQPARPVAQAQGFVEAAEEYLAFEFHRDLLCGTVALAVDQYCTAIAIDHFPRFLWRRAIWWAAEVAVIPTASKVTFESYPRGSDDRSAG